jgi:hypothetical protein
MYEVTDGAKHSMELVELLTWECIFPTIPQLKQLLVTDFWRPLRLALQKTTDIIQCITQSFPLWN